MLRSTSVASTVQPRQPGLRHGLGHALRTRPAVRAPLRAAVPEQSRDRAVVLPGALWLLSDDGWSSLSIRVQGDGFIMQRSSAGAASAAEHPATGLVRYVSKPTGLAVRPAGRVSLAAMVAALPLVTVPVMLPATTCTGIVPWVNPALEEDAGTSSDTAGAEQLHGLAMVSAMAGNAAATIPLDDDADFVYETYSHSPRRTKKIKFTCGRCGATNIKPINPHAYTEGSVFAKCGKCNIMHKLIDNLRLFHELSGPVFDVPPPASLDALLPERLRLHFHQYLEQEDE